MGLFKELGISTIYNSPRDAKILIAIRFLRFFSFGGTTIILALHLHHLGFEDSKIGLFMSLTLLGDVFSFLLTVFADSIGRRFILFLGTLLMTLSGLTFAFSSSYILLLLAAIIGIISPNGREIGPFSAIEESTLAHLTPVNLRGDVFAWYALIGNFGAAIGKLCIGSLVGLMENKGLSEGTAYRWVFGGYAAVGILSAVLVTCLGRGVEISIQEEDDSDEETMPLLLAADIDQPRKTPMITTAPVDRAFTQLASKEGKSIFPQISKESRIIVTNLCLLFAIDSFASGLVPASWITYFFSTKFHLPAPIIGRIFSLAALLSTISTLLAASLCRRIGPIPTIVFTHLPSAIFLSLIPLSPSLPLSIIFLLARSTLGSMDIAPKAAFISNIVKEKERTAVMGFVNVVRTGSQSLGPVVTGVMSQYGGKWGRGGTVAFVVAGLLKAGYDLGLLWGFGGRKFRAEKEDEEEGEERNGDEERAR